MSRRYAAVFAGFVAVALDARCRPFNAPVATGVAPIAITLSATVVAPRGAVQIQARGGRPPYSASFSSGGDRSGGSLSVPRGGSVGYTAGAVGGVTDDVVVTDALGSSAAAAIAVGPSLTLSPPSLTSPVGGEVDFTTAGGASPICLGLAHQPTCDGGVFACPQGLPEACLGDGGSCVTTLGVYTAGPRSAGSVDWGLALDANSVCAVSSVQVGSAFQFTSPQSAVAPGQTVTLDVSGGLAPFQINFAPSGNLSGGTVTSLGQYVAGPNADMVDTLVARDSAGVTASLQISVGDPEIDLPSEGSYLLMEGDFNGDQIDDLVAISVQPSFPAFELILGGPTGLRPVLVNLPLDVQVCAAAVADLNGDGIDDLMLAEIPYGAGNDCNNTFVSGIQSYLGSPTGNPAVGPLLDFNAAVHWNSLTGFAAVPRACGQPSPAMMIVPVTPNATCNGNCDRVMFFALPDSEGRTYTTELGPQPFEQLGGIDLPTNSFEMTAGAACPNLPDGGEPTLVLSSEPESSTGCTPADTYGVVNVLLTGLHPGRDGGLEANLDSSLPAVTAHCFDSIASTAFDLNGDGIPDAQIVDLSAAQFAFDTSVTWSLGPGFTTTKTDALSSGSIAAFLGPSPRLPSTEIDSVGPYQATRLIWSADAGALLPGNSLGALPGNRNAVAIGDFNEDGVPDIAMVDQDQRLTIRLGTSDGMLGQVREFAYSGFPALVGGQTAGGHIDADGTDELILLTGRSELFLGVQSDAGADPGFLATGATYPLDGAPIFAAIADGEAWWELNNADAGLTLYRVARSGDVPVALSTPWLVGGILLFPDASPGETPVVLVQYQSNGIEALGVDLGPGGALDGGVGPSWQMPLAGDLQVVAAQSETALDLAALFYFSDGGFGVGVYGAQTQQPLSWSEEAYPAGSIELPPVGDRSGFNTQFASFAQTPASPGTRLAAVYTQLSGTDDYQAYLWILDAKASATGDAAFTVLPLPGDASCYTVSEPGKIHAADIDGDGFTDLLVFQGDCSIAYIAWGQSDGGFSLQPLSFEGVGLEHLSIRPGGKSGQPTSQRSASTFPSFSCFTTTGTGRSVDLHRGTSWLLALEERRQLRRSAAAVSKDVLHHRAQVAPIVGHMVRAGTMLDQDVDGRPTRLSELDGIHDRRVAFGILRFHVRAMLQHQLQSFGPIQG